MSIIISAIIALVFVASVLFLEIYVLHDIYSKKDADRYADDMNGDPKFLGFATLHGDYNRHFPDDAWIQMVDGTNPEHTDIAIVLVLNDRRWRPTFGDVVISKKYVYGLRHDGEHIMYRHRRSKHHDKLFGPIIRAE